MCYVYFIPGNIFITAGPSDQTVVEGTDIRFTCVVDSSTEVMSGPVVSWKKDGHFIDHQANVRMIRNERDNSLTINSASLADTGTFTCVANSTFEQVEWSATLTVFGEELNTFHLQ